VEWPVVLMGSFDERSSHPPEVIRTTIRANQKCFVLAKPGSGKLAQVHPGRKHRGSDGGPPSSRQRARDQARLSDANFSTTRSEDQT